MAVFEFQTPDGKTYEVDAPDENSALQALEHIQNSDSEFATRATALSPIDLSIARAKEDPFGQYLRTEAMQPRQGETPAQREQRLYGKPMRGPSKTESFVRGAADTMSWGYGDEMAAGMEAATGGNYDQALKKQRASAKVASRENPKTYLDGQVFGALAPAVVTAGGATAPTLGGRVVQGGLTAGGQGAVYGFGSGEDGFANRSKEALKTGAISTVLGGAAPVAARGVGLAWSGIANWLAHRGIDAKSSRELLDMLKQSGMTPEKAQLKLNDMGPEAMLADLAPGMQVETAGTARASTEAGNLIDTRLSNRRAGAEGRVNNALDDAFGLAADPYSVQQATRATKSAISPEYEAAIANAPALPRTTADLSARSLTNPTKGLSLENRQTMLGIMNHIDDALAADHPSEVASRLLDLRKRLDASIAHGGREIVLMSPADRANQSVLKQARNLVGKILKDNIPGIAEADAKHAPLSRAQSAFDQGRRDVLKGGSEAMTPAELAAIRASSSPIENTMRGQGIRTEIGRVIGNQNANPANKVDRILSRDWNREKIAGEIGPQGARNLEHALDTESTFTETSNLAESTRGSRTNVLEAAQKRWGTNGAKPGASADAVAAFAGGTAIGGPTTGIASGAGVYLNRARQAIANALLAKSPDLIRATAEKLTTNRPARDVLIEALTEAAAGGLGRAKTAQNVDRIIRLLIASQAPLAGQQANRAFLPSASGDSP